MEHAMKIQRSSRKASVNDSLTSAWQKWPLWVPLWTLVLSPSISFADLGATDPGVRGGPAGAGGPLPGMNSNEIALFNEGLFRATELEATCHTCSQVPPGSPAPPGVTNSTGLGGR